MMFQNGGEKDFPQNTTAFPTVRSGLLILKRFGIARSVVMPSGDKHVQLLQAFEVLEVGCMAF